MYYTIIPFSKLNIYSLHVSNFDIYKFNTNVIINKFTTLFSYSQTLIFIFDIFKILPLMKYLFSMFYSFFENKNRKIKKQIYVIPVFRFYFLNATKTKYLSIKLEILKHILSNYFYILLFKTFSILNLNIIFCHSS